MNLFYVYHLIHKETNKVFYVGKGKGNRLNDHQKIAFHKNSQSKSYLYRKIRKILSVGDSILAVKIYETNDEIDAFKKEVEEIKRIGRKNLCNATDGGEGFSGGTFKQSDHQKRIVSEMFSKPKTSSHKIKLRNAKYSKPVRYWKGKTFTKEHKDKLSASKKGRLVTDEQKAHLSKLFKSRKYCPPKPLSGPKNTSAKRYIILLEDNIYKRFSTLPEIAKEFNVKFATLWKLLKTGQRSRKGLSIRLLETKDESSEINSSQ